MLPDGQRPAPVGRDDVVDEVRQGLRGAGRVVLEGPPGIGRTTTLGAVLADVRGAGTTVLACSPAEAESDLPYAALVDLVRPPAAGHPQAMKTLHLSRTTYYRRLAEATDRLAAWVLEEHARQVA